LRRLPSNLLERRQHFLKAAAGATRTEVVAAELFEEFFVSMNYSMPAPNAGL
jgi:hypothetical protein